jgi:hypothetical protein
MCLAAGGAPVAMKCRAVNQSTKIRTSLYIRCDVLIATGIKKCDAV